MTYDRLTIDDIPPSAGHDYSHERANAILRQKAERTKRKCIDCGEVKPLTEFPMCGAGHQRRAHCRTCHLRRNAKYRGNTYLDYATTIQARQRALVAEWRERGLPIAEWRRHPCTSLT